MALSGIAAVWISVWAVILLRQTLKATHDAVEQAQAANEIARENIVAGRRAWLTIEDVRLINPTQITEEGVGWVIEAKIKNIGPTPATSMWINFHYFYLAEGQEPMQKVEARFKDGLKKYPSELGEIVFPNVTHTQRERTWQNREAVEKFIRTNAATGARQLDTIILVGVSYRVIGDDSRHLTYQAYNLINIPIGYVFPPGPGVELPPMPFKSGEVD
jgi:hypothetical protein